jgi:riboflavin kinase/FMN adenylyltransferase
MQVLCIGNFEGVHRGHAALIDRARLAAGPAGRVVAVAFEPLPVEVLRPETSPVRLSTPERKRAWLHEAGADEVMLLEATPDLLSLDPEAFIDRLQEHRRQAGGGLDLIVEGPDFRFGRDREGDVAALGEIGRRRGFAVEIVPELELPLPSGLLVAARSSVVRRLVADGRVLDAAAVLGRPPLLEGPVVPGDRQGRTLGWPTANLDHGRLLLPADGVYGGWADLPDGTRALAAISVGRKPTFEPTPPRCEVHLVGRTLPLDDYGWPIRVWFHRWIRGQIAFPGVEPLLEQMARDVRRIEDLLATDAA